MNCADFERLIALDVEGDLPAPQGRAVADHLPACPSCRQFAEQLKFSQALLKGLGQEPVDEPMLQEVRRRVRNGLAAQTPPQETPVWQWGLGAGLVAALIFAVLILRHHRPGAATQVMAERSTPANAARPSAASKDETQKSKIDSPSAKSARGAMASNAHPRRSARETPIVPARSAAGTPNGAPRVPSSKFPSGGLRASANAQPPQPLTVKLLTDNPNVVIYWLID